MATQRVSNIIFGCATEGCEFRVPVPNFESLTEEDRTLLNLLTFPEFDPSEDEVAHLHQLLGEQIECPTHGKATLGFIMEYEFSDSMEFIIELEGDNEPKGLIAWLKSWFRHTFISR